ncbi:MAG: ATPase [Novosphingobium sp.]|nr:ATPase [Novosphingobium sp.]
MNGGSRIIAFGSSGNGEPAHSDAETDVSAPGESEVEEAPLDLGAWSVESDDDAADAPKGSIAAHLPGILALVAIAGWTAFYVWANGAALRAPVDAAQVAGLIQGWCLPVLLVCLVWLIAMRSSTREATRFGMAARLLSDESTLLETRLVTVNRELSLAREFIAAQSRDLESLGRIASERLSANAERLQALVMENGDRVESIGQVSTAALDNMEKLRGQLPVIASSAKDVTNSIASAGRTAHAQIEEMVRGFHRLNEFGQASEAQVLSLRDHVNETLTGLAEQAGHLETMAEARFVELGKRTDDLRTQFDRHEVDALAAIRTRAKTLADELEAARTIAGESERETLEKLSERISALRDEGGAVAQSLREGEDRARQAWSDAIAMLEAEIAEHAQAHERSAEEASHRVDIMSARLAAARTEIEGIAGEALHWDERTREALTAMTSQMTEAGSRLIETETQLAMLTEAGVRLFELLHGSAEKAGEELPRAIGQADADLARIETRAAELAATIGNAGSESSELATSLDTSRNTLSELAGLLEDRQDRLRQRTGEQLEMLESLSRSLAQIDESHEQVAAKARNQLAGAIAEMEASARETLALIDTQGAAGIERITSQIRSRSAEAVEQAIHNAAAEISGQLEQSAAHAAGVSREATIQLRDQLAKVHELVANLENRVDRARERAEEQVDNDFARRAALITESLNSSAIDIAKAFSADVSDKAWEGYLRGDRGIFTRRALSLIEASEARSVLQIFETDDEFRELVSRYIHDFEAMLRQVLSTRDGKSLGVTLLSSDMGKLYVALAQAIERLRT